MHKERTEGKPIRKIVGIALGILLLLLAVLLVLYKCGVSFDDVKKTFSAQERADELYYEYGNRFAKMEDGLLVVSESKLQVVSSSGETAYSENILAERPVVRSRGQYAVAYDSGGTEAWVVSDNGFCYREMTEDAVFCGSVNENGWLALGTSDKSFDGCVTVYDQNGEAVYQWFSGDGYCVDAQVSSNNKALATVVVAAEGSRIVLTNLNSTEEKAEVSFPGSVPLELQYVSGNTLGLLTDIGYYTLDAETGEQISFFPFEDQYIQFCGFGDGMAVIAYSRYQLGLEATLTVIDAKGEVLGSTTAENEISALSVCGKKIAVLSTGKIAVYNKEMLLLNTFENISAETVAMCSDGSVLAIGTYSAVICEPLKEE